MLQSLSVQDILLSKIDRDDIERVLQSLQINVLSAEKNKSIKDDHRQVRFPLRGDIPLEGVSV